MWRKLLAFVFVSAWLFTAAAAEFILESKDFKNGGAIPLKCTLLKGGTNEIPELHWSNPPAGAKSFVITCIDYAPVAKRWVHWVILDIPAGTKSISHGKLPKGVKELMNQFGKDGYGGPKPPKGTGVHRYVFKIYALRTDKAQIYQKFLPELLLERLLRKYTIGTAKLIGTCEQK